VKYVSLFSGIEAATAAWHPLGWEPLAFSEIDANARAVLTHHHPTVPLHGDMTTQDWTQYRGRANIVVGGSPCQAFSVAGLRRGLADPRGNLTLSFLGAVDQIQPEVALWENVPGVLSIDGGRVFGAFLGALGELGYGTAYRVLDAQFFGVPQRRRRVFVVGCAGGDWERAARILFEPESLRGDSPPSRQTREGITGSLAARTTGGGGLGTDFDLAGGLIHAAETVGSQCADTHPGAYSGQDAYTGRLVAHSLRAEGFDASEDGTGRETPLVPVAIQAGATRENPESGPDGVGIRTDGVAYTLEARAEVQAIAFHNRQDPDVSGDVTHPLGAKDNGLGVAYGKLDDGALESPEDLSIRAVREVWEAERRGSPQERRLAGQLARELRAAVQELSHEGASPEEAVRHLRRSTEGTRLLQQALSALQTVGRPARREGQPEHALAVRRLTPRECERLQGFPDDYTLVLNPKGKPMANGPRYKMLGNSMAVPVMRWIGERIAGTR
jgi:DNA (cytosine-5)-methyltransferase 1